MLKMNSEEIYQEKVIEVIEKEGIYMDKPYHNYQIVTSVSKNGVPFRIEFYKGSVKNLLKVHNCDSVDELRTKIVGYHIIAYSYDKFGKLNSFVTTAE